MQFPQSVYLLRSRPHNNVMSYRVGDKTYHVGFLYQHHVLKVAKYVSESSEIDGVPIQVKKDTVKNDPKRLGYVHLTRISKKININKLPCMVHETPFLDFTSWSVRKNVGIGYAYNLVTESDDAFLFEVQVLDPWDDVNNFIQILFSNGI